MTSKAILDGAPYRVKTNLSVDSVQDWLTGRRRFWRRLRLTFTVLIAAGAILLLYTSAFGEGLSLGAVALKALVWIGWTMRCTKMIDLHTMSDAEIETWIAGRQGR